MASTVRHELSGRGADYRHGVLRVSAVRQFLGEVRSAYRPASGHCRRKLRSNSLRGQAAAGVNGGADSTRVVAATRDHAGAFEFADGSCYSRAAARNGTRAGAGWRAGHRVNGSTDEIHAISRSTRTGRGALRGADRADGGSGGDQRFGTVSQSGEGAERAGRGGDEVPGVEARRAGTARRPRDVDRNRPGAAADGRAGSGAAGAASGGNRSGAGDSAAAEGSERREERGA